jgi:hypothetical protein
VASRGLVIGMRVVVGAYLGMVVLTAAIAAPASKMACQASTPLGVGGSIVMGAFWPVTLPSLIHAIRYPEK